MGGTSLSPRWSRRSTRSPRPTRRCVAPKVSIGTSHEGRTLWMWKVSDNPHVDEAEPEVRFDALHHAREPEGMMAALLVRADARSRATATNPRLRGARQRARDLLRAVRQPRRLRLQPDDQPRRRRPVAQEPARQRRRRLRRRPEPQLRVPLGLRQRRARASTSSSETYRGPSAGSEPETQAIIGVRPGARVPDRAQSVHTYGGFHLFPFGYA